MSEITNAILVDYKDYHKLYDQCDKEDIEVIINIKGKLSLWGMNSMCVAIEDPTRGGYRHIIDLNNSSIESIYKIQTKATPLQVGEILVSSIDNSKEYKVLGISCLTLVIQLQDKTPKYQFMYEFKKSNLEGLNTIVRKSGVPIDWDATFKQ